MKTRRREHFVIVLLIVLIGVVIYANSLNSPFVYDDIGYVVENVNLKKLSRLPELLTSSIAPLKAAYRPLLMLSFALNYLVGGLNPFSYHAVNLLLHISTAILLYFLIQGLVLYNSPGNSTYFTLPCLTALLFLTHPIQTEAVVYISARSVLLASFFYLFSLLLFLRFNTDSGRRRNYFYLFSLIFFALALFSKEIAITLPVILVLYSYYFLKPRRLIRGHHIPFFILAGLYFLLRMKIGVLSTTVPGAGGRYLYLITSLRVIPSYLRLLILPINQSIDHDFFPSSSFFESPVILSLGVIIFLLILGLGLKRYSRGYPFGTLWFFITLLPTTSIIPLHIIMNEHRLYLPSIGFFLIISLTLVKASQLKLKPLPSRFLKGTILFFFLFLIISSMIASKRRAALWRDEYTLWSHTVQVSPNSYRAHNNLGTCYRKKGWHNKAIDEFQKTLALNPDDARAHSNLGVVYQEKGWYDEAITEYQKALTLDSDYAKAHNNLGTLYGKKGWYGRAIDEFQQALRINPDYAGVYYNLGIVYKKQGLYEEATSAFQEALALNPDFRRYNLIGFLPNNETVLTPSAKY